ncbi:MAG: hypothetical protein JWN56_129 [Sphingobacteriales bacterium]|nr:hypothetical protein [Sphingobacteriales bacterium]
MVFRKLILLLLVVALSENTKAQQITYDKADSMTYAQYMLGNWKDLKATGENALKQGVDFPYLRLRIAYANFVEGNYSAALNQYKQVLKNDSFNETARLYSYWCYEYLNRNDEASYHASKLRDSFFINSGIKPFGLLRVGVESSYKMPDDVLRNPGAYYRFHLSNRLFLKLKLEQAMSLYKQQLTIRSNLNSGNPRLTLNDNQQVEYYGKLSYPINSSLILLGAYHYLNNDFGGTTYQNHIGLGGLTYSMPYYEIQGDVNLSSLAGVNVKQYNAGLTIYPKGNLNLYTVLRVSVQNQAASNQIVFTQVAGSKIAKFLWLEANVTLGKLNNYLDADAVYVYNSIDPSLFKAGSTAFIPLKLKLLLHLNYTYEQKENAYELYTYNQHSITGGLTWKF